MFAARVQLRKLVAYCCIRFYHTSLRVWSKRNLVPERFLTLAETSGFTNASGKKIAKNYNKKRLEKSNISKKEYIYGISPCLTALEANRRKFYTIYFNDESLNTKSRPQFKMIKTLSTQRNIPTKSVSRKRLDDLCGHRPHQNIVMKVGNLSLLPLKTDYESDSTASILNAHKNRPALWLILQGIQDPMNMGAILRTAVFLGVDKVVSSEYDSCALTPAVSKASAGAMEALPVYSTNIKELLKRKREEDYEILGTVSPHFVPQENRSSIVTVSNELKLEKPSLLVL
ncbi:rRNA methyltransferase 1, mitochondrial, partial [Paramuricea clavata]